MEPSDKLKEYFKLRNEPLFLHYVKKTKLIASLILLVSSLVICSLFLYFLSDFSEFVVGLFSFTITLFFLFLSFLAYTSINLNLFEALLEYNYQQRR